MNAVPKQGQEADIEILKNGSWVLRKFRDLKKDDTFRYPLENPDDPIFRVYKTLSKPYRNHMGDWCVLIGIEVTAP